jgi:hypothetical protein
MDGVACVAGTRIPVAAIAGWIANGLTADEVLAEHPQFNAAVRLYFLRLADQKTTCLAWLDAMLEPAELARAAEERLRQVVALRNTQGAV